MKKNIFNIIAVLAFLFSGFIIYRMIDPPAGYTQYYGLRMWNDGQNPGADSLNQNWIDVDSVLYDMVLAADGNYFVLLPGVDNDPDTLSIKTTVTSLQFSGQLSFSDNADLVLPKLISGDLILGGFAYEVEGDHVVPIFSYKDAFKDTLVSLRVIRDLVDAGALGDNILYVDVPWTLTKIKRKAFERADIDSLFILTDIGTPMGEINYFDLTGTTITITTQSTTGTDNSVKVSLTSALNGSSNYFDNGGSNDGRLRYIGTVERKFYCSISISFVGGNSDLCTVMFAKNGTPVTTSAIAQRKMGLSADVGSTAIHGIITLTTNDYIEAYVANLTNDDDITVRSLNIIAK